MRYRAVFVVGVLALSGCTSESATSNESCPVPGVPGALTVLAASSTKNVLTDIRADFLETNPCVTELNMSFGSSGELAAQIVNGAPADVFLAASETTKNVVTTSVNDKATVALIARNKMAILVHSQSRFVDSIQKLTDLQDVINPDIKVGVCVASAPCGSILPQLFESDELDVADVADTTASSAQDLVTKVVMGELDAGIVFESDCVQARRTQSATCVEINQDLPRPVSSPLYVVALTSTENTRSLFSYLTSSAMRETLLKKYGFLAP